MPAVLDSFYAQAEFGAIQIDFELHGTTCRLWTQATEQARPTGG